MKGEPGVYTEHWLFIDFQYGFLVPITAASAKTVTYVKEYTYQASEVDSKLSCRTIPWSKSRDCS